MKRENGIEQNPNTSIQVKRENIIRAWWIWADKIARKTLTSLNWFCFLKTYCGLTRLGLVLQDNFAAHARWEPMSSGWLHYQESSVYKMQRVEMIPRSPLWSEKSLHKENLVGISDLYGLNLASRFPHWNHPTVLNFTPYPGSRRRIWKPCLLSPCQLILW